MTKTKLSSADRAKIVLESFTIGANKKELCAKYGISRSTLYLWQKILLARLAQSF